MIKMNTVEQLNEMSLRGMKEISDGARRDTSKRTAETNRYIDVVRHVAEYSTHDNFKIVALKPQWTQTAVFINGDVHIHQYDEFTGMTDIITISESNFEKLADTFYGEDE